MVEIDNHDDRLALEAQLKVVNTAYPLVGRYIKLLEREATTTGELPRFDDNDDEIVEEEN